MLLNATKSEVSGFDVCHSAHFSSIWLCNVFNKMVKKNLNIRFYQFGFHSKEALVMKIKWGSPYSCFEVEKPLNMLSPGVRRILRNHTRRWQGTRQRKESGRMGWPFPLPCCFVSCFCNFPQQEACSLWDVPPSSEKNREKRLSPNFFLREGGASVHRLEACSGWFPSSGWKTLTQGLKHSQHTDKHKKESLEGKFNAHFAHLKSKR